MELLAGIVFITGAVTSFVGWGWLILISSKKSVIWAYTIFFVPVAGLVYGAINWESCKRAMIPYLGGFIVSGGALMFLLPVLLKAGHAGYEIH